MLIFNTFLSNSPTFLKHSIKKGGKTSQANIDILGKGEGGDESNDLSFFGGGGGGEKKMTILWKRRRLAQIYFEVYLSYTKMSTC